MLRIFVFVFFLLLLSACDLFVKQIGNNQFSLNKQELVFSGHNLGKWPIKTIPQCKQCSFNLYTKKMLPGAMLFKEINNERGDLVFLSATNIRHHFALQAGGSSYPVGVAIKGDTLLLSGSLKEDIFLMVNQVKELQLGQHHYFVYLQKINTRKNSVDLIFWLVNQE